MSVIPFRETRRPHGLHEGPFYGYQLRDILTDSAPVTERHEDRMRWMFWRLIVVVVFAAIMFAVVANL